MFRGGDSDCLEQKSNVLYSVARLQCEDMIKYIKNKINREFLLSLSRFAALPLKTSMLSSINVSHTARLLAVQRVTVTHVRFLLYCFSIPHGTNDCSTARGELSACRLRGGRCYVRLTASMFYIGSSCSKIVVPFGGIPLNQLQSLRDRNPRGITFGYAARDHCFVIASVGVKKRAFRLFFLLPLD